MEETLAESGEFCRLCSGRGRLLPVIKITSRINMKELIFRHLNITICEGDVLPTMVCSECWEKVVVFHEYYLVCSKVQMWLTNSTYTGASCDYVKSESGALPSLADSTASDRDILKDEVKLERAELKCDSPEMNVQEDAYPDSDSSSLPLLMISSLQTNKKKNKKKSKQKEKLIKIECDNDVTDRIIDDYTPNDLAETEYEDDLKYNSKELMNSIPRKRRERTNAKVNEFINFQCSRCNKDCLSWYRLRRHSIQVHKHQPTVRCMLCNVCIKSKSVMYKHVADHNSPSVFTCDVCPKITKSIIAMENHKMRHIPKADREYKCESCPKILKTNDSLKSHRLVHVPIEQRKKYPCSVCNMKFTSKSAATGHKRAVHDKIKRYVCDLCGYACGTSHELRQHRAIHSDEKLFVCNVCSKPFKTDSNLRTHLDTHESTSYQCSICSKVLNTRRTFRKHLLVHETQRKHVCSFCKLTFKRRQTLKVHLNSHTGDKPIACRWCGERFMYAASYRMHRMRRHPEEAQVVRHNDLSST